MEDVHRVRKKDDEKGLSQLHLAAIFGDMETAKIFLMSSANADVLDINQNTPLHYATRFCQFDILNFLLSNNACVNHRNSLGQTSLHMAAESGQLAVAQLLLDSKADVHISDQSNNSPIDIAAMYGRCELVQLLKSYNKCQLTKDYPLHLAATCGNAEYVKQLLTHNDENHDAKDLNGDTPLHLASEYGHLKVVEILLRNNADASVGNTSDKTPLHIAAEMGYAEIVTAIIDDVGRSTYRRIVNAVDVTGNTALHFAASNGHSSVVNVLLNQTAERNERVLSRLEVNKAEHQIAELPIPNTRGETSSLFATECSNFKAADRSMATANDLLNQTVDREERTHSELDVNRILPAELEPSQDSVINSIANPEQTSNLIFAKNTNFDIADTGNEPSHSSLVNVVCKRQASPRADIGKNLMLHGANVNACNNEKITPLHLACQNGYLSIAKILVDNHATVDVTKQSEMTPIYLATKNGHADVLDLLLSRGLCDFVLPISKETPLHVAVSEGHTKVVEIILKHTRRICEESMNDRGKFEENAKNLIETRTIKLLRSDGRQVSAEAVFAEQSKPLEIWRNTSGYTALDLAIILKQPEVVKLLLDADRCSYSERDLNTCFISLMQMISHEIRESRNSEEAAEVRRYQMNCESKKQTAQALIESRKFNVNNEHSNRCTPLRDVILFLSEKPFEKIHRNYLLQMLLQNGADFNLPSSFGKTPLITASYKGCCDVIQILLDWEQKSEKKLDLDARDLYGATALMNAIEGQHVSTVRLLLDSKTSVNVQDCYGLTALHAAVCDPLRDIVDLDFFCEDHCEQNVDNANSLEICSTGDDIIYRPEPVLNPLQEVRDLGKKIARIREEMVQLLLAIEEIDVNVKDLRGNTPLDLAVKASTLGLINSATLNALKSRGAICSLLESEEKAPDVDERGRNPLHRLVISNEKRDDTSKVIRRMAYEPEHFIKSAAALDDKGRTPLHYAFIRPHASSSSLVSVLLNISSNLNATDIYGKTPLHYAETSDNYEFLVKRGADEDTKDKYEYSPKDLKHLRYLLTISDSNAKKFFIGKDTLYASTNCPTIAQLLYTNRVTDLSKRKLVATVKIHSQSPGSQESSDESIWKIWNENDFIQLNRRMGKLKPPIHQFVERLADGIKEKDWRFECQPILVGSAKEETQVVISADYDYSLKLIKFSQRCHPFPHPLGPNGYFELRRKSTENNNFINKSQSDEDFDVFFNSDQCLLTNDVNFRFKCILEEVLRDPYFWRGEHLLEWNDMKVYVSKYEKVKGLCKNLQLRMIHPVEDGEGGFLFVNISIDFVACVQVEGWWPDDPLPLGIDPSVKAKGSTFVFHAPGLAHFNRSEPRCVHHFSETFSRITFAQLESQMIKECSFPLKAAYMVCKMILFHDRSDTKTYELKTCLLFCMESIRIRHKKDEGKITRRELTFWVERIVFCYMQFYRHGGFVHYFMPSFRNQTLQLRTRKEEKQNVSAETFIPFSYALAYDYYLDVCPDDTTIDIPIVQREDRRSNEDFDQNYDLVWKQFDREEFMRTLSSRGSIENMN